MSKPQFLDVEPENKNQKLDFPPLSDEEIAAIEGKIEKLLKFFGPTDKEKIETWDEHLPLRTAYPNNDPYAPTSPHYDTQKWLETVRQVYWMEKNGTQKTEAIKKLTADWKRPEVFSFLNWLRFYEGGNHTKYKVAMDMITKSAQGLWYEGGSPGYFLEVRKDAPKEKPSNVSGKDIDFARDEITETMGAAEKKSIIEKQRAKIIGRLDSAEKLLRSSDGQLFAGKELEALMESIYGLKKKIQLVNKMSSSLRLYEDMIVRESNVLVRSGFVKAADRLRELAEEKDENLDDDGSDGQVPIEPPKVSPLPVEIPKAQPLPSGSGKDGLPPISPTPPAPPTQPIGYPGGWPSKGPGMPQTPPESAPNEVAPPKGISDFLERLDGGKISPKEDRQEAEDVLEVDDDEMIVVEAQEIPPSGVDVFPPVEDLAPKNEGPKTNIPQGDVVEVEEGEKPETSAAREKDFDALLDATFSNITVQDIIDRLEMVNNIFKMREVSRQLAIIDLMAASLKITPYLEMLGEAAARNESNNSYCKIRLDDAISKLQGTLGTSKIDLTNEKGSNNPEAARVRKSLEEQNQKEEARKDRRKQQEEAEEDLAAQKETPVIEVEEDLAPKNEGPMASPQTSPIIPPAV